MSNLDDYKTEHLFLLVGKNPLPNYVAAKLLGVKGKTRFYLIYSKATESYAENLKVSLQAEFDKGSIETLEIKESNPSSINAKIENYFKNINDGEVNLNYTGGTKTMAVHSYLAIKKLCEDKKIIAYFSYLNPRELELRFDHLSGRPFKLADPNHHEDSEYFKKASIDLITLLALHGYKSRQADETKGENETNFKNPRKEPQLIDIAKCLFDIHNDDSKRNEWKTIVNNLSNTPAELPNCISNLKATLKAQNLLNDEDKLDVAKHGDVGFPSKAEYIKWLQGKWLEDYLLQLTLELKVKCNLHDCGASLEPAVPGKGNEHKPFFELDVVALRGYQLFALSCTTADKNATCKEKLLEVFVRAKQLGGDEARIALVCRHESSNELQGEIEQSWDVEKRQVKVFGKKEWAKLEEHLERWLNGKA